MEDKMELLELSRTQNHKGNGSSVGTTDPRSGDRIRTYAAAAAADDCGVIPVDLQKQEQRTRGSNLPKGQGLRSHFDRESSVGGHVRQRTRGLDLSLLHLKKSNSKISEPLEPFLFSSFGMGPVPQPTSSSDGFMNGDIDEQCSASSNKNHKHSLEYYEHSGTAAGKFSNLPEFQGQCDPSIDLELNQESFVGGPGTQHTSSGDGQENGDMDVLSSSSSNLDHMPGEIEHVDKAAGKKLLSLNPQQIPWKKFRVDDRDQLLLLPNLSWEEKVLFILDMVRRREITEYNPKQYCSLPTRFCQFNIALFDLCKESDFKREPRFSKIPETYRGLDPSINIISIKVAESDVPFPINIYGTVLARDQVDYRCVYLFKHGRDNPQHITSTDDTLTLTGPYRALAGTDSMFFEFNLKIKSEDGIDKDFSKGLMERNAVCASDMRPRTKLLRSCLSKVKLEYIHVPYALEASLEVNVLNKESCFDGQITAGDKKNGILLYDSSVAGTETKLGSGGSVPLTRRVVAVPWGFDLVLNFSVRGAKGKSMSLEHYDVEWTFKLGIYELQVKITWTGVFRKDRANVLKKVNRAFVLI